MGVMLYVETVVLGEAPQARQYFSGKILGRLKGLYTAAWDNSVFSVSQTFVCATDATN
jgi:hypothetical protein